MATMNDPNARCAMSRLGSLWAAIRAMRAMCLMTCCGKMGVCYDLLWLTMGKAPTLLMNNSTKVEMLKFASCTARSVEISSSAVSDCLAVSGRSLVLMLFHYRDPPPLPSYQYLYILRCTVSCSSSTCNPRALSLFATRSADNVGNQPDFMARDHLNTSSWICAKKW